LTSAGGKLYIVTRDNEGGERYQYMWVSDGTTAGTKELMKVQKRLYDEMGGKMFAMTAGDNLFFLAFDKSSVEIWGTDGTPEGTVVIDGSEKSSFVMYGEHRGELVYAKAQAHTVQLYQTNGTTGEPALLTESNW
jgi:ELWxxDGT repeat protein